MAAITTPVKRFIAFQMLVSPKKFAEAVSTEDKAVSFDSKDKKNTQVLLSNKAFRIEYNPRIQAATQADTEQPKTYEDVIIAQCGLPPVDKNGKTKPILYALVQLNKKSLREFGRWLSGFMNANDIPLELKDGSYRISFHNSVGASREVLESIGFSNVEDTDEYVFTGNDNDDADDVVIEEHEEQEAEDTPPAKPKKQTQPKAEQSEDAPKKLNSTQKLELVAGNICKYLKTELKTTPVMVVKDADVAKAMQIEYEADSLAIKLLMRKLQAALNERFATQYAKEDGSISIIVWQPSKKRVPVSAMKI